MQEQSNGRDSGNTGGPATDHLQSIRVPVLMDTAQFDDVLEPRANSTELAHSIPGAREIVRPVGHFAYVPLCQLKPPPSGGDISAICADPDGVDRVQVHKEAGRDVVEFFNRTLSKEVR